ncbi:2-oxoglutarate (2OG) and Fe(II)-dependent oxygenase superfamily protein [Rhynchospora pubera]|uniref:2-oxoglutarate (2OG) and Fe(II)-dependent oxygenase superfamily protein n=1 Tax=Rhynchospora pubera TaxID=906938 RepID=A0AAV8EHX8_9POAL|nr:2-oxoglutarate (2OG) and Fe(II)-dependent oxygenase superfamily protein [Rhynchospora pubera]
MFGLRPYPNSIVMEEGKKEMGSRLVQELAMSGRDAPTSYIQRDPLRQINSPPHTSAQVPVIDLNRLSQSDGADESVKFRDALQSWGLFLAVNHGIPSSFLDEVLNLSTEFFHLPLEEKQKFANLVDGKEFKLEGYGNDIVLRDDQTLDWNDRLYLLVQPEDQRNLDVWPTNPVSFRDVLHTFGKNTQTVRAQILRAMAKVLELKEDCFVKQFDEKANMYARFNYYPLCKRPDLVFGLKPHADASAMTILLLDKEVAGLQVRKNAEWVDVPVFPDSLLVVIGDGIEIMSNGIFKSPIHRVVANSEKERLSVVMFSALDPEKNLEPLDELIDETRPRMYKTVKTKDYLADHFKHFAEGKRTLDFYKI